FLLVSPGNPFAVALSPETIKKIGAVLKKRPDLILLTDDVYGTFVPGFRSLMGEFPENTIGVYSYSKYFGCTGWRLGTIAVYEDNIFDKMIAAHPEPIKKLLDKRYGGLTLEPRKFAFIDRIVADSRDIALNHTAGLPLPISPCAYPSQTWRITSTTTSVRRYAPSRAGTGRLMRQLQAKVPHQPRPERNASSVTSRCYCNFS